MSARPEGLFAAPYTPMHPNGSVNYSKVEQLARSLKQNGVSGAFINGTTGESMSLSVSERQVLTERWVESGGMGFPVIAHVGHLCLGDAQALAAHAAKAGAAGIAATAPCYYKPQSLRDLVDFCAEVASAAPNLPFYYYHIPCMTQVNYRVIDFFELAVERIPSLRGAKFSHEDLADLIQCVHFDGGRMDMLYGKDEMLLSARSTGVRAFVGSTFNFAASSYLKILRAFDQGDTAAAQAEQLRAAKLIDVLSRSRGAVAGKALMNMIGLNCGPARLPQRSLSESECESLAAELGRIGFTAPGAEVEAEASAGVC